MARFVAGRRRGAVRRRCYSEIAPQQNRDYARSFPPISSGGRLGKEAPWRGVPPAAATPPIPLMLRFRYTCERHQRIFVAAARRGGCRDFTQMDGIRRRMLAWMSARFPTLVFEHFTEESCLGCKLEANGIPLAEVEPAIVELAQEFAPAEAEPGPSPPRRRSTR